MNDDFMEYENIGNGDFAASASFNGSHEVHECNVGWDLYVRPSIDKFFVNYVIGYDDHRMHACGKVDIPKIDVCDFMESADSAKRILQDAISHVHKYPKIQFK